MLASKRTKRGVIGAVVLASLLAVSGYALTTSLTGVLLSHAGDSAATGTTEVMTATAMHYVANTADPSKVDAVQFHLDKTLLATGTAYVQLVSSGATPTGGSTAGTWYACVTTGTVSGLTATITDPACDTTTLPPFALDIDVPRVVAYD